MWGDDMTINEPSEQRARSIDSFRDEPFGLETVLFLTPIQRGLHSPDFGLSD